MEMENKKKSSKLTLVVLIIFAVVLYVAYMFKICDNDYTSKTEELIFKSIIGMYSNMSLPQQIDDNLWLNEIHAEDDEIRYIYEITGEMSEEDIEIFKMVSKQDMINSLKESDLNSLFNSGYVFTYIFNDSNSNNICSFSINKSDLESDGKVYYP